MADFCKQCSIHHFGRDTKDLAGMSTGQDTVQRLYIKAICEGCGFTWVDHEGVCVATDCMVKHDIQAASDIVRQNSKVLGLTRVKKEDDIEF